MWFTLALIALVHAGSSIYTLFLPTTIANHASGSAAKSINETAVVSSLINLPTQSKSSKAIGFEQSTPNKCETAPSASSEQKLEVQFHGLTALEKSDALKILRDNGFCEKRLPGDQSLLKFASVMAEALKSIGYLSARVDVSTKRRNIDFFVSEGTRSTVSRIQFEGNQAFSTEELEAKFRGCLNSYHPTGYDKELSDYCLHQTLSFMRSRGYLQAMMQPSVSVSQGGVELTFKVNEGKLFRLGKVSITGVQAFEVEALRSLLPIHEGDVASGELIAKWLFDDLKNAYGERGYIEYTAEPTPIFQEGVVDFDINVEEGNRFSISSISLLTDGRLDPSVVSLLRIHEGDYYDEKKFKESIERLNSSGMFAEIDPARDVEFKTSDNNQLVALTIKLRPKQ